MLNIELEPALEDGENKESDAIKAKLFYCFSVADAGVFVL